MKPPAPQTRAVRTKRASLQDNALGANYGWASPGQSGQKDAEDVGPGFGLKDIVGARIDFRSYRSVAFGSWGIAKQRINIGEVRRRVLVALCRRIFRSERFTLPRPDYPEDLCKEGKIGSGGRGSLHVGVIAGMDAVDRPFESRTVHAPLSGIGEENRRAAIG